MKKIKSYIFQKSHQDLAYQKLSKCFKKPKIKLIKAVNTLENYITFKRKHNRRSFPNKI